MYTVFDKKTNPGTTPGGDSDGSSNGGSSSRRAGGSNGGQGTVQINEDEVPLAVLPDSAENQPENQLTQIDEDDVPLAVLPKMGQGASAAQMMLFLSGAVLTVYASLFRKEEE